MRYVNKVTGAVVETKCIVSGENWIEETSKPEKNDANKAHAGAKKAAGAVAEE